jgi:hypothetical protein
MAISSTYPVQSGTSKDGITALTAVELKENIPDIYREV